MIVLESFLSKLYYLEEKLMEMALRTSNLKLPQGFVEMDREEMMYVDGGKNNVFFRTQTELERSAGVGIMLCIAFACGISWMISGKVAATLALTPEPTFLTKVVAGIMGFISWYSAFLGGSALVGMFMAFERYNRGKNYSIGVETVFGIPVGFNVG